MVNWFLLLTVSLLLLEKEVKNKQRRKVKKNLVLDTNPGLYSMSPPVHIQRDIETCVCIHVLVYIHILPNFVCREAYKQWHSSRINITFITRNWGSLEKWGLRQGKQKMSLEHPVVSESKKGGF